MDQASNVLTIIQTDYEINGIIKKCKVQKPEYTMHFSQNEDFFLKIRSDLTFPHFNIHHDIKKRDPDRDYITKLSAILNQILPYIGNLIADTSYFFDPAELLRPCFYRIYTVNNNEYLYLLRLDLGFKPHDCEIMEKGNNDTTHIFKTRNIYLEAEIIPLEKTIPGENRNIDFFIKQSISQTWIGETGRGYFIQGIWMDSELTRFFSRLFIPDNLLTYPYYPFPCKYRTICHFPFSFSPDERLKHIEMLDKACNYLDPHMRDIEKEFRTSVFSPEMKLYADLKKNINDEWINIFQNIKIKRYINTRGMREYELCT